LSMIAPPDPVLGPLRQKRALVHESELARNDPNPQVCHLPMAYDTGLPR
jgi:hypothetical protein